MFHFFEQFWSEYVRPIYRTPVRQQVAALCYKNTSDGRKVLLITSRDTGRWIVPKGWPIKGKDGAGSALQEAWEEAGVKKAEIAPKPIGAFAYKKGLEDGTSTPVEAQVYPARVVELKTKYPEVHQRKRAWFTPKEASKLVDEPDLKAILRTF